MSQNILDDIDRLLISIQTPGHFFLIDELNKIGININKINVTKEEVAYLSELTNRMISNKYIIKLGKGNFQFDKEGYEAREKGGHFAYLASKKTKITKHEWISLIIAVCALIMSALPYLLNRNTFNAEELVKRIEVLEKMTSKHP